MLIFVAVVLNNNKKPTPVEHLALSLNSLCDGGIVYNFQDTSCLLGKFPG